MVVNIQAIKFNASDKLEAYVQKKVAKLEKLCSENSSVDVFMKLIKPETAENKEVEIKIKTSDAEFFASKVCDTFEEATDRTIEALQKQIIKQKER
ncbi:MAG: ribosome-associated translation inhibitor RaiA [Paludibacteraceae bacterium]|nr:ribosome-associated translation inhibitor RaiA [Paludibacteraceae bacterium]